MSKILVARSANLGFVKVVGRGSFQNSGCLQSYYREMMKAGANRFVIDLDACTYLDSTFLGILLGLGLQLKSAGRGLLHILNASPRNLELLKNLGLDRLFHIQGRGDSNGDTYAKSPREAESDPQNGTQTAGLQEVHCKPLTREEAAPTILKAHENLMEFDANNVPKFKDVVEFLREDLNHPVR